MKSSTWSIVQEARKAAHTQLTFYRSMMEEKALDLEKKSLRFKMQTSNVLQLARKAVEHELQFFNEMMEKKERKD
jgi:hypothetical protein